MSSTYALLKELPNANAISSSHLTHLIHLLSITSKGCYGRNNAVEIRNAASVSIGSFSEVKLLDAADHFTY